MSTVWNYFQRNNAKTEATCNICKKIIKTNGGSTSGVHSHLKTQHKINSMKRKLELNTNIKCSEKSSKITTFFSKAIDDSFPAVAARMVAKDGMPFTIFCTSMDLRNLLIAKGYNVPKSSNTIRDIIMKYAENINQSIVNEISQRIHQGETLSLTFDEWTSLKNRRYMNVNVHAHETFWNLGLCRVSGSMPADKCIEILKKKLSQFNIHLEHIISITTDEASIMQKVGRLLNVHHQLCLAHGIQLAIVKVLYKNYELQANETEDDDNFTQSVHNFFSLLPIIYYL